MQIRNILCVAILSTMLVSCGTDFKKTKGGMPYKLFSKGNGPKVQMGDVMKFQVIQSIKYKDSATGKQKDSVLFSSYAMDPVYFQFNGQTTPYDMSEVYSQMRKGDSMYAVQEIDTFIRRMPGRVPTNFKHGQVVTTVHMLDIFKSGAEAKADQKKGQEGLLQKDIQTINDYLTKNHISAQRTPSGAFVQMLSQGSGPAVQQGNLVTVNYTGRTLDGTVFDSSTDSSFQHATPLKFSVGQMIPGFNEGIVMLKKGDKAKFFIPSPLGYGAQSPSPKMKPNSILIFDIDVLDVQKEAPPLPQTQVPGH